MNAGADLQLGDCEEDTSDGEHIEHRWLFTPEGFFRSQRTGLCLDVDGDPGTDSGARLQWGSCEFDDAMKQDGKKYEFKIDGRTGEVTKDKED